MQQSWFSCCSSIRTREQQSKKANRAEERAQRAKEKRQKDDEKRRRRFEFEKVDMYLRDVLADNEAGALENARQAAKKALKVLPNTPVHAVR